MCRSSFLPSFLLSSSLTVLYRPSSLHILSLPFFTPCFKRSFFYCSLPSFRHFPSFLHFLPFNPSSSVLQFFIFLHLPSFLSLGGRPRVHHPQCLRHLRGKVPVRLQSGQGRTEGREERRKAGRTENGRTERRTDGWSAPEEMCLCSLW
jgi:hypothetical protein